MKLVLLLISTGLLPLLSTSLKLHIGGEEPREGWQLVNARAVEGTSAVVVSDMADLSWLGNCSVSEIYASHVLEHTSWRNTLSVLREWRRVLQSPGTLRVAVPDLAALSRLFLDEDGELSLQQRFEVLWVVFGAHQDSFDHHGAGFDEAILSALLLDAGFCSVERVDQFWLFEDYSTASWNGTTPISLNLVARASCAINSDEIADV